MSGSSDPIERMKEFNLQLRRQVELAEALLPAINQQIQHFAALGLSHTVILGKILHQRSYTPGLGPTDSGQVYQAAIMVPGGLGIVRWDSEQHAALLDFPDGPESEASIHFVPLDECEAGIKALLVSEARNLLDQLVRQLPRR
jgi:hypothetical protein